MATSMDPANPRQTALDLPHTAWDRVVYFVSDSLETLLILSAFSPDLQRICRPHASSFFSRIQRKDFTKKPQWLADYPTHTIVHMILSGDINPASITDYQCPTQYRDREKMNPYRPVPTLRPGLSRPGFERPTEAQIQRCDQRVREAINASRWIALDQRTEVFDRFQSGDADAAGLILLPLLPNLRGVEPPIAGGLCANLFSQVALESRLRSQDVRHSLTAMSVPDTSLCADILPFSQLLIFYLDMCFERGCHSFWLDKIIPFLGIPSLQRIVLFGIRDSAEEFHGWPTDAVACSCPEIYFALSSVPSQHAMEFAKGLTGPCKLMLWFNYDHYKISAGCDDLHFPEWDHLRVGISDSGDRQVWTSLELDGGRPGYAHAWASWLWHKKMQDWRLLGEPFTCHDGDELIDFLYED